MAYTILIVDDEEVIREGLKQVVSWETLGYHISGAVPSGEEALRFLERNPVDVVLADIRMPRISGIELARLVKLNYPDTRVIILSGYDNFSYAQNAIRYGVYHYLLKPCAEEEIIEVFTRLHGEIDRIKARQLSALRMHRIMSSEELANLIAGKIAIEEARELLQWKLRHAHDGLAVMLLQTLPDEEMFGTLLTEDLPHLALPPYDGCEQELEQRDAITVKLGSERNLCVIPCVLGTEEETVTTLFSSLKSHASGLCLMGFVMLGILPDRWQDWQLNRMLAHADSLVWNGLPDTMLFVQPHTIGEGVEPYMLPDPAILATHICFQKRDGLELHWHAIPHAPWLSPVTWFQEYGKLLREAVGQCGADFTNVAAYLDGITSLLSATVLTAQMFEQLCNSVGMRACRCIDQHKDTCYSKSIRDALSLIEQRYQNNVNLEELSRELGLTATYLSKLFKREVGVNFKEYLLEKQMTEAKRLLRETNDRIYEIAEAVGFSDQHYFSEVFKRSTSLTPLEYRKVRSDA